MVSPFLNIVGHSQGIVSGTPESAKKGVSIGESGQGESTGAFSEVLGDTQNVQLENSDASPIPIEDESLFPGTVLENFEVLDQLVLRGVNLNEQVGNAVTQSLQAGSTSGSTGDAQIQGPLAFLQQFRQVSGTTQLGGGEPSRVGDSQSSFNHINILGAAVGQARPSVTGEVRGVPTETSGLSSTISLVNRLNNETGVVAQFVRGQESRERPLLNENAQSILAARPSSVLGSATLADQDVNVQRLFSALEGTGSHAKTDVGSLSLSNALPSVREDLSQGPFRAEGDGRTVAASGSTQGGEAGLGTTGGGLPFGNYTGNGQSPLLDSSQGTLVSAGQGQVVAKAGTFDERLQLLNTSVPQRLQIDVQLSEAARVQVDVGVQQRQVYAGVLLDNPVLRALASQNVQDLANQLGQADMELEEFDVHEENHHLSEQASSDNPQGKNLSGGLVETRGNPSTHQEQEVSRTTIKQERGWHFVA